MHTDYTAETLRFGGANPYVDADGKRCNLSHETDFSGEDVVTDGLGNIIRMPILRRKPCFGRPERFYRGFIGGHPWRDESGTLQPGKTPCNTCFSGSPGVYEACLAVVDERVRSNVRVAEALDRWMDACGEEMGSRCFVLPRAIYWRAFLDAIVSAGGWSSVNDNQVKIDAQVRAERARKQRNEARKLKRKKEKAGRAGRPTALTPDYLQALRHERDRRAQHIKGLRQMPVCSSVEMRWLRMLPDGTCDRVADVWMHRELLRRTAVKVTNSEIAKRLLAEGKDYGVSGEGSLAARVGEDFTRRLAKLEEDRHGQPIWPQWRYVAP